MYMPGLMFYRTSVCVISACKAIALACDLMTIGRKCERYLKWLQQEVHTPWRFIKHKFLAPEGADSTNPGSAVYNNN